MQECFSLKPTIFLSNKREELFCIGSFPIMLKKVDLVSAQGGEG
jgi:hypothetical protein